MCGIAGIHRFRSGAPVDREDLETMAALLNHRGPDDEGFWLEGDVGLAHRRLAILDTSRLGRGPMATPDGDVLITYNGEIYNFLELRADLEGRGHRFRTGTDTEVLLHLWREHGEGMLELLNGMFAFALWDRRLRKLFLVRDRLGIKPLYYRLDGDGISFASEVKALLRLRPGTAQVDIGVLDAYMSVGYVPTERTLFAGVQKLQPGHCLTVERGEVRIREYWDVRPGDGEPLNEDEAVEQSLALLRDAVRLQLRSDVPLGVFLSGGIDSSAVVALMAERGVPDIRTFTVAYDFGTRFDETRYARLVAERFATRHQEVFVTPREFQELVPTMIWHMDEPVTEAAAISLFFIARLARQHGVIVVLSGEGSDEVFGGYPIYKYMQELERYRRLPAALRRGLINPALGLLGPKWRKYTALSERTLEQRYLGVSFYERDAKESLYRPELRERINGHDCGWMLRGYYARTSGRDPLQRMMYTDLKSWLPDDLLVKADKMTMACSVELRVPFLDHRLVELGARIPSQLKIRGWETKHVLKRAMRSHLPAEILDRGKMGFPTPLARMFQGPMRDYVRDLVDSPSFHERGYFRPERVRQLLGEHESGDHDHHRVLWQLLVLEEWHRQFIDAA
jgi:asparagine synthase (glutamine-hydrolysing)